MADLTLRLVKGTPLTNAEVDANFSNLNEAITVGSEPMGHADRTQSTLAFDAGSRTVTIAPVSGSFTVWVKGNKFVFSTAQTVVIPNTTGLHYVFFDASGVLSTRMSYFDWPNEAPTAYVAWNSTTGAAPFFADERHGVTLDWQTHEYLHRTRGAAIANGFSLGNYSVSGDGSSDAHAQLDLSGGTFFDEDLQVDITPSNTPTPNTWEQDLTGPAQIPVLYRSGTGWVRDTATNFVLKAGTATPRYNTESGGVWGLTDVPNNSYSAVWVIATNNLTYPVVAVMGQAVDSNAAQAENFEWSGLNLDGFPSVEFRPLYKIIFQCSASYANTIKARFTKVFDNRNIVAASPAATIGSSHGGLSGLGADDHLQYLHITEVRSPSAAVKNSLLPTQTGNSGKFLSTDGTNPSWATMTAPNNGTLTLATSGSGLSGSASFTADQAGNSTFTVSIASATANTVDTLVLRDGSGNFAANIITANSFSGSASGLTGLKTVNGNSILGSGNIQIDGGVTSFNARTGAITLSSADVTGALGFTPYNSTNPNGYTTNLGTVVGVTAGTGLTGGTITSSGTISLATSGVAAGTYTKVTVDTYGRATTGTSLSSSDVTTALGYTPYNSTNPSGYITSSGSISGSAGSVSGLTLTSSANGINPDSVTQNQIGYNTSVSLFGQTDGGLYSSAYSSSWVHQIYGDFRTGQIAIRGKNSGTWQAWRTVLDSSNYTSYRGTQLVSPNGGTVVAADSAMPDSGHSFIHTLGYGPSGNDGHILGMTWSGTTSSYGAQIWVDTDPNNRMAFRSRSSTGAWTGWNEVIHSGNYTSYAAAASHNHNGTNLQVGVLTFNGEGGDSGNGSQPTNYGIYQQGGSWTHPYPDLCIGFHTGIKIGAHYSYNGTRFYNNSDWATEIFSVGNGDNNVRAADTIYAAHYRGNANVGGTGEASHHPAGIYSNGTNWLYGTMYLNGNTIYDCGRMNGPWTSGSRCYSNEWIEFGNYSGLYSPLNGAHFYPNNASYGSWRIAGSRNGWYGLEFDSGVRLMMNGDTHGFHNTTRGWAFYNESGSGYFPGNITAYWSDGRLKDNQQRLTRSEVFATLAPMRAHRYNWNAKVAELGSSIPVGKEEVGLIAQHVQTTLPDAAVVNKAGAKLDSDGFDYLTINYDRVTPFTVEAVNIHEEDITSLKTEVAHLKALVAKLIGD